MSKRFIAQAEQHWLFFRSWVRAPLATASLVPSSRFLASKMVAEVPKNSRFIIELGAGTGPFTRKLLKELTQLEQLMVVELNPEMSSQLQSDFPSVTVVTGDAAQLQELVQTHGQFAPGQADAIISGLGLLNMPNTLVSRILSSAFDVLKPGAPFIQFTYGPTCPVNPALREKLGLTSERAGFTLRNVPPASVYVLRKNSTSAINSVS